MIAYFFNKNTLAPWTGLSPTVTVFDVSAGVFVVTNSPMVELPIAWWYTLQISFKSNTDYAINYEPNNTDYTYSVEKVRDPYVWGGSGVHIDYGMINEAGKSRSKQVIAEIEKRLANKIDEALKDMRDRLDYVCRCQDDIMMGMDAIGEKEGKDYTQQLATIKMQLTKLSSYLKVESNKEIEEKIKEHEQEKMEMKKIIDKMEEAYKMLEEITKEEVDEKEKEKTGVQKVAEEYIDILEEEIKAKPAETIEKLKSLL